MIIHITNAELEETLSKIKSAAEENVQLPVNVSYKIIKNKLVIEQALAAYRIARDEIINNHSDGSGRVSEKENPEEFERVCMEIATISKECTDVDIVTISLSELGERELPLNLVSALGFMITAE